MATIDYKEKYEQALERAKGAHNSAKSDKENGVTDKITEYTIQLTETIFPELADLEVERIRKCLIYYFKEVCDNVSEKEKKGVLAWLEKQGEQKSMPQEYADAFDEFMSHIPEKEPEFSENCYNYDDMVSAIQFGIKWQQQHDSIVKVKPKYEPKFHKGDWVIGRATENEPRQIAEITEDGYKSTYGGWYGFSFEEDMHLWTIQDAKDGDVLTASDGSIFLFAGMIDYACKHYVALTTDGVINFNEGLEYSWETSRAVQPATKEQRDILEKAMNDEGYTFDFEKKELKKIEQKPAWSEEDKKHVKSILLTIECCKAQFPNAQATVEAYNADIEWLKSLRPQSQWKPSDEQIKVCKEVYADILSAKGFNIGTVNSELNRMEEELKKLREE